MSSFTALNFVAREILAFNETLPVVVVEMRDYNQFSASTQGDRVTFSANIHTRDGLDMLSERLRHVAALLQADESEPIPDLPVTGMAVQVSMEERLRPHARPVYNGHNKTVWPELPGYRH